MSNCKEQLMQLIAADVMKIDHTMQKDLENITNGFDPLLIEVLNYGIFNGGKRLRPILVLLAARLAGGRDRHINDEELLKVAMAFEYLHGATLYHDDVIDRADLRRGKASVVSKFGGIAAILGGDFLHSRSMYLVGTTGGGEALKIFCNATNAMVDGEFLQLRNANNYNLNQEDYFLAVRGKTALLISATCEVGAIMGGANIQERNALKEYGLALGVAFQIVDDLLDYQGDTASTGKSVGNDFQEGKMTLPVILALENCGDADREHLLALLHEAGSSGNGFDEAYSLIDENDGFVASREKAELIVREALAGLELFSGESAAAVRNTLHLLAEYVLVRKK